MARTHTFSSFPGRAAVLRALTEAGSWTPRELFAWARCNGGSCDTYAALDWYVRRGRVVYAPAAGWSPVARFSVAASQKRGRS